MTDLAAGRSGVDHSNRFDVAIVGYGPVAKVLAILLAQAGRSVLIVERHPGIYPLPRATHLSFEAMRIFDAAGLGDQMREISHPKGGDETQVAFLAADRSVLFTTPPFGSHVGTWPIFNIFNQPQMETLLHDRLASFDKVVFRRAWQATAIEDLGDQIDLTCQSVEDARREHFRARYLVGADGANSFVRRSLKLDVVDTGFKYDFLLADLRLHQPYDGPQYGGHVLDPARPLTFLTLGRWRHRFEFMLVPGETAEDINSVTRNWELVAPWGFNPSNATLERHAVYAFRALWAEQWRKGRVLLAGDSAHLMPPFLGDGLCGGLRDAIALGWRLNMILDGTAADGVLDSYGPERLGHIREVINVAIEHGRLICITDPDAAAERDAWIRGQAPHLPPGLFPQPRLGPGLLSASSPIAGTLAPQGIVRCQGREGRFDEVVGRGFCLLGDGFDPIDHLSDDNRSFLARISATVAALGTPDGVQPSDHTYSRWFAETNASAILYRPDFNIFGAVSVPAQLNGIVDQLRAGVEGADLRASAGSLPLDRTFSEEDRFGKRRL